MVSFTARSLYSRENSPLYPVNRRLLDAAEKRKKSLATVEIVPWVSSPQPIGVPT
jgi:hypothetical protein